MRRWFAISIAIIACCLILPGAAPATAQDEEVESGEPIEGYPIEERLIGGPTDVDTDLITSFPKKDSIFPGYIPDEYFAWKEDLYEKYGVKLSFSYQMLYQRASETLGDEKAAWGGWMLIEGKWEAFNRGLDYQGSLVFDVDWRHTIGGAANPALFGTFDVGSLWPTDIAYFKWDPAIAVLYWEQWFTKDTFVLRVGKQLAANTYDFFRFKDARTSFSASPFTAHTSIPMPAFGQGVSFKWWPVEDSEFYVHGTLNDMNGDPTHLGLDTFFEEHQYFYGLEAGYYWKRNFPADFDHVHVNLFYADERDSDTPILPNEAGGGFKVLGSKQWNRWVGFGSYTFNTAEGGGLGATFGRNTVTGGAAYLKPLGVRGQIGLGASWMDPFNEALDNQYGGELHWKLLLTPDLWVTPGLQLIWNPSFNPGADFVYIPQLKFRLFF